MRRADYLRMRRRGISGPNIASYTVPAPQEFDGTNDFQSRGAALTGVSSSKVGTGSMWINWQSTSTSTILRGTPSFGLIISVQSNLLYVEGYNSSSTRVLRLFSKALPAAPTGWVHWMWSYDLAAGVGHLYRNGVDDELGQTITNDTIAYASQTDWAYCAIPGGSGKTNACMSQVWMDFGNYYDLSSSANRDLFYNSATGKPVDLGADGSNPGTTPIIYTDNGDLSDNKGSGGNFTTTGALTACSSNPSD